MPCDEAETYRDAAALILSNYSVRTEVRDYKVGGWTMGRLHVGRLFSALAFSTSVVLSTLVLGGVASASPQWCEEDPTFVVNGAILDVTTQFPAYYQSAIKGPVEFELLVPANAIAAVVSIPGSVPLTAKVTRSLPAYHGLLAVPVVVRVTVPAAASFDTQTRVAGTYLWLASNVKGKSNVTTYVSYYLLGL